MLDYSIDFTNGAKVTINDGDLDKYKIIFTNNDTKQIIYTSTVTKKHWAKTLQVFYINWNIKIIGNEETLVDYNINLQNKKVLIRFQSKSLGDSIAWIPYVEEFRKLHNCDIYCSTHLNGLYSKEYQDVKFILPGQTPENTFAIYDIGWFDPYENMNPQDYKLIPLQQTITDILGLKYKEIITKISKNETEMPLDNKYVCIGEFSTANAKHWHYPYINSREGWQELVDWLNSIGYKVMVISKQHTHLKNVIDRTGNFPLNYRILELTHCDFYIGIGSGLSWLAWALGKKVVMISGFSDPICEFKEGNIRVTNTEVCNGCFNKYKFDRGDWNWCPVHKNTERQFECTKTITPKMVIDKIISNKLIDGEYDFDDTKYDITLSENDIDITNDGDKILIRYKNETQSENIHIDIIDNNGNTLSEFRNSILNKNHTLWSILPPSTMNIVTISLFNNKKSLLKLNYMLKK